MDVVLRYWLITPVKEKEVFFFFFCSLNHYSSCFSLWQQGERTFSFKRNLTTVHLPWNLAIGPRRNHLFILAWAMYLFLSEGWIFVLLKYLVMRGQGTFLDPNFGQGVSHTINPKKLSSIFHMRLRGSSCRGLLVVCSEIRILELSMCTAYPIDTGSERIPSSGSKMINL